MRRTIGILIGVAVMLAMTATTALAAVVFHSGPTFTVNNNGTVTVTADMSGLGNDPATAFLTQTVVAQYTCVNKGGNVAPGQQGIAFTSPPASQDLSTTKNGRAQLNLTAAAVTPASQVSGRDAGCPNGNWTGVNPVIISRSATLTIVQGGEQIFSQTYNF